MNIAGIVVSYLIPTGLLLIAWGGLSPARSRIAVSSGLMAISLATAAYLACGFAFQFGGLGFATTLPGYEGLRGVYSLLNGQDAGWGMMGLRGFFLDSRVASPEVVALFLHSLPLAMSVALIPSLALAGRVHNAVLAVLTLLLSGLIYPLAGNWIVAGGWLANLGVHVQLGHGAVDYALAGPVYLMGGLVAMVGLLVLGAPSTAFLDTPSELPPAHFPLLAGAGGVLYGLGWMAWVSSAPLHAANPVLNLPLALANGLASAAMAAIVSQLYSWFATAYINPLIAARGWLAGWIIVSAGAPFVATWTALVLGALAGIWLPMGLLFVERVLHRDDPTGAVSGCAVIGLLAVLAPGAFSDGNWGAGWNGVGLDEYLTVVGQGVTGVFVPSGFIADPGQFTAQLVELVVVVLVSVLAAWIIFGASRLLLGKRAIVSSPTLSE